MTAPMPFYKFIAMPFFCWYCIDNTGSTAHYYPLISRWNDISHFVLRLHETEDRVCCLKNCQK